jgi:hypothetical protein
LSKILIKVILCLAIWSIAEVAHGQQTSSGVQPPPPIFFKLGLTGIFGDQQYLYVMAGGKILQYEIAEMTLRRSVDLPDPALPTSGPPKMTEPGKFPPPPPPALPHGLWAGNGLLYVLAGPVVSIYRVSDLTLQKTMQLPKPESPQVGN